MRKGLLLFALFALLVVPAAAQGYAYIPDNNAASGGGNNWPLNFSSTTGRFIQLLNIQYLPNAPVKIVDVAFSRYSTTYPSSFQASQFQMRMSHTTRTAVSGTFADNFQACPTNLIDTTSGFTYAPPAINTWSDFGTVADFGFDGQRNICLEIRYRGQVTSLGFPCRSATIARVWANSTSQDNYVAVSGSPSSSGGLKTRLTYVKDHILIAPDTIQIGGSGIINMYGFPGGSFYQLAASFGQNPLPLGPCTVFLDVDSLLILSILTGPPIFVQYSGTVPATGTARAQLSVPASKALVGLCVHHAAVSYTGSGIQGCTNTGGTQLVP